MVARQWGPIVSNHLIRLELHNEKWLRVVSYGFIIPVFWLHNMEIQENFCKTIAVRLCENTTCDRMTANTLFRDTAITPRLSSCSINSILFFWWQAD